MSKSQYPTVITSHHITLNMSVDEKELATCWIVVNDVIKINGIRIILLNGCLQVKYATDSTLNPDYRHIAHPVDPKFRSLVEQVLLDAYKRIADNEKVKRLFAEKELLREQQTKAREEHRETLASALGKAIELLDMEIQQS